MAAHITLSYSTTSSDGDSAVIKVTMKYYGNGVSWSGVSRTCKITLNGTTKSFKHTFTTSTSAQTMGRASFTISKTHAARSLTASGSLDATNTSLGTLKDTVSVSIAAKTSYTITLTGSGSNNGSYTKWYNEALSLPSSARTGYTFNSWSGYTSLAASYNQSATLTSQWTANKYTVTLNQNGGSGGTASVTATYNSAMPSATMPLRTGYTFAGYYDATSGGTQYYTAAGASARVWNKTVATTLYARWTPNTYTVAYNGNGATGGSTTSSSHTYNVAKNLTSNGFTRTNYIFLGWSTSSTATTATYTNGQSVNNLTSTQGATINLYAVWKLDAITLTLNANGGTIQASPNWTGSGSIVTKAVVIGQPYGTLPVDKITRTGYSFDGWFDNANDGNSVTVDTIAGNTNTTIYAHWTAIEYTLTANANNGTITTTDGWTGTGTTATKSLYYQDPYGTLPNIQRTNYNLTGWFTAASGGSSINSTSTMPAGNTGIYAQWRGVSSTLTANPSNGSFTSTTGWTNNNGTVTKTAYYNETYGTLPSVEKTGYTFQGWNTGSGQTSSNISSSTTYNKTSNTTIYAAYTINSYTLTANANGGTIPSTSGWTGSGATVTKSVQYNSSYGSLPTPTRTGYDFSGWYTAIIDGTSVTSSTTMGAANVEIFAHWNAHPYKITYNETNPTTRDGLQPSSISGNVSEINTYYDNNVTLSKQYTRQGYNFNGWIKGSTVYPYSSPVNPINALYSGKNVTVPVSTSWTAKTNITVTLDANSIGTISGDTNWTIAQNQLTATKQGTYNTLYTSMGLPSVTLNSSYGKLNGFYGWSLNKQGTILTTDSSQNSNYIISESPTLYAQLKQIKKMPEINNLKCYRCNQDGSNNVVGRYGKITFTRKSGEYRAINQNAWTLVAGYKVEITYTNVTDETDSFTEVFTNQTNNNFSTVLTNELELKRYNIVVKVTDNSTGIDGVTALDTTATDFISAGNLLFDGYKDITNDWNFDASRAEDGRSAWFRTDIDGRGTFVTRVNDVKRTYVFIRGTSSDHWYLDGVDIGSIYTNYGIDYNSGTLPLVENESIIVYYSANTTHIALGGVADGRYQNIPLSRESVKLYGDVYTVQNNTETALSEYLRMSIDSTDTKKLNITFGPYTS